MIERKVHFIGIGGIGISALARWFLSHGYYVSGSDSETSSTTEELKRDGAKIVIGHKPANIPTGVKLVVHTAAIKPDNVEIRRARSLKIPVKSYAEALGDLSKKYKTIAVSGAHGKSTTTALLSLALIQAGFDPTVFIGTKLREFGNNNFRNGKSPYLVLEADEYHKSFLNFSPFAAIITNIDKEHLDFYKNLTDIKNAFLKFIQNMKLNGILVLNKEDQNLFSLKPQIENIAEQERLNIQWYGLTLKNLISAKSKIEKIIQISGKHNISNALAVYVSAKALGVKDKAIFDAIKNYKGAWRRMEYKGKFRIQDQRSRVKVDVYDDYAHHPTEIKATLAGITQKWPKTGVICVFQPHQAKRLIALFKEFTGAFFDADILILLDLYKVPGRDKMSQNINSAKLAEAINKRINSKFEIKNLRLREAVYLPYPKALRRIIETQIQNSKIKNLNSWMVIMMGAGDIVKYTDRLLR